MSSSLIVFAVTLCFALCSEVASDSVGRGGGFFDLSRATGALPPSGVGTIEDLKNKNFAPQPKAPDVRYNPITSDQAGPNTGFGNGGLQNNNGFNFGTGANRAADAMAPPGINGGTSIGNPWNAGVGRVLNNGFLNRGTRPNANGGPASLAAERNVGDAFSGSRIQPAVNPGWDAAGSKPAPNPAAYGAGGVNLAGNTGFRHAGVMGDAFGTRGTQETANGGWNAGGRTSAANGGYPRNDFNTGFAKETPPGTGLKKFGGFFRNRDARGPQGSGFGDSVRRGGGFFDLLRSTGALPPSGLGAPEDLRNKNFAPQPKAPDVRYNPITNDQAGPNSGFGNGGLQNNNGFNFGTGANRAADAMAPPGINSGTSIGNPWNAGVGRGLNNGFSNRGTWPNVNAGTANFPAERNVGDAFGGSRIQPAANPGWNAEGPRAAPNPAAYGAGGVNSEGNTGFRSAGVMGDAFAARGTQETANGGWNAGGRTSASNGGYPRNAFNIGFAKETSPGTGMKKFGGFFRNREAHGPQGSGFGSGFQNPFSLNGNFKVNLGNSPTVSSVIPGGQDVGRSDVISDGLDYAASRSNIGIGDQTGYLNPSGVNNFNVKGDTFTAVKNNPFSEGFALGDNRFKLPVNTFIGNGDTDGRGIRGLVTDGSTETIPSTAGQPADSGSVANVYDGNKTPALEGNRFKLPVNGFIGNGDTDGIGLITDRSTAIIPSTAGQTADSGSIPNVYDGIKVPASGDNRFKLPVNGFIPNVGTDVTVIRGLDTDRSAATIPSTPEQPSDSVALDIPQGTRSYTGPLMADSIPVNTGDVIRPSEKTDDTISDGFEAVASSAVVGQPDTELFPQVSDLSGTGSGLSSGEGTLNTNNNSPLVVPEATEEHEKNPEEDVAVAETKSGDSDTPEANSDVTEEAPVTSVQTIGPPDTISQENSGQSDGKKLETCDNCDDNKENISGVPGNKEPVLGDGVSASPNSGGGGILIGPVLGEEGVVKGSILNEVSTIGPILGDDGLLTTPGTENGGLSREGGIVTSTVQVDEDTSTTLISTDEQVTSTTSDDDYEDEEAVTGENDDFGGFDFKKILDEGGKGAKEDDEEMKDYDVDEWR